MFHDTPGSVSSSHPNAVNIWGVAADKSISSISKLSLALFFFIISLGRKCQPCPWKCFSHWKMGENGGPQVPDGSCPAQDLLAFVSQSRQSGEYRSWCPHSHGHSSSSFCLGPLEVTSVLSITCQHISPESPGILPCQPSNPSPSRNPPPHSHPTLTRFTRDCPPLVQTQASTLLFGIPVVPE